jgi:hypothetical protein
LASSPSPSEASVAFDSTGSTGTPLALRAILSRTWRIFDERLPDCVGVFLASTPLDIAAAQALLLVDAWSPAKSSPQLRVIAAGLGVLMFVLCEVWVSLGVVIVLMEIADGKEFDFGSVFHGGRFVFRAVAASVVFVVAIMLSVLLIAVGIQTSFQVWLASGAGLILTEAVASVPGVVAGVFVALRLSQFPLLILNRDVGALESLRLSWLLTRGHTRLIVLLALVALAVNVAGLVLLGVGLVLTVPFTALLWVIAYQALITAPVAAHVPKGKGVVEPERELR